MGLVLSKSYRGALTKGTITISYTAPGPYVVIGVGAWGNTIGDYPQFESLSKAQVKELRDLLQAVLDVMPD